MPFSDYNRDNPHPLAVEATRNIDKYEEVAEYLPEDEQGIRFFRFGRVMTDRKEWGWAVIVWLYEDYTGTIDMVQPYGRLDEMRRLMREDVQDFLADQASQAKAEIDAEYAWLRAAEAGSPSDWADEDLERQRDAFYGRVYSCHPDESCGIQE